MQLLAHMQHHSSHWLGLLCAYPAHVQQCMTQTVSMACAGSSMGATSRQPDMHLPASVPEAEMETRPSMATTSAFSDHPSEAAPSTPRSQAMHRASPIAIQPPGKRTSIFRAFGVKRGQARAEGAGQDAQGGPQQEAAAAKLAPEEKPSELLPAELTGAGL